jgi:hypothetical protein
MMTLFPQVNRPDQNEDETLIWIDSTPNEAMTAEGWFPRSSHNGPRGLQGKPARSACGCQIAPPLP